MHTTLNWLNVMFVSVFTYYANLKKDNKKKQAPQQTQFHHILDQSVDMSNGNVYFHVYMCINQTYIL